MKVTKLALVVIAVIHELCQQAGSVTARAVAQELGVAWKLTAYLTRMHNSTLIMRTAGPDQTHYVLSREGERLCESSRSHINIAALKQACREYQALLKITELQDALEVLLTIKELSDEGKKAWPGLIADKERRREGPVHGILQKIAQKGLVASRLETKQESFADASTSLRRLYELNDVSRKLLEVFT